MGISLNHDAGYFSGGAFSNWKVDLAKTAGYPTRIERILGTDFEQPDVDYGTIEQRFGNWSENPSDPLMILLIHADTGSIKPKQAGILADRLEELVPQLPVGEDGASWKDATEQFISGLRQVVKTRKYLRFE